MKKSLLVLTFFIIGLWINAQTATRWQEYFSYNNVSTIIENNGILFSAAENGIFTYDPATEEMEKISKVNDLNQVGITAMAKNEDGTKIMVGYESGALNVLKEDGSVYVLDIPWNIFTGDKKVKDIFIKDNLALISGNFGVTIYNLDDYEFEQTAFFVSGGSNFTVNQAVIYNNEIYAASAQGIYHHALNNQIPNFPSWELASGMPVTNYDFIKVFNNKVIAANQGTFYQYEGNNWSFAGSYNNGQAVMDLVANGDNLLFVTINQIQLINTNMAVTNTYNTVKDLNTANIYNNAVYGGTQTDGLVLVSNTTYIIPDGPATNNSWNIKAFKGQLFVSPGSIIGDMNAPSENSDGYFHFNKTKWINNKSEDFGNVRDIVHITVNPSDSTEIYVSSWYDFIVPTAGISTGLLRIKSGQLINRYTNQNSALVKLLRVGGTALETDGTLWVSQSFLEPDYLGVRLVKKTANNSWSGVSISDGNSARPPVVGDNFVYLACSRGGGVKAISKDLQSVYSINTDGNSGNLPSDKIYTVALDKSNNLWIGTLLGLRVLTSPEETLTSGAAFEADDIVIVQDGTPEELLRNTKINDIAVDEANRKWVATNAGVFYFSEYGDETINRFTQSNSPLPSNTVLDIDIDSSTGIVYFATDKGMVSYRGDVGEVTDSFGDVLSYPNPVRPGFTGKVVIKGLPNNAVVKITDVNANLVFETKSSGGIAEWDTTNSKGKKVASGVYFVLMTNSDGTETRTTKIAVVR